MKDNKYGFGENPPYSLYQADNGKWGLIDGSGKKLEAAFNRGDDNCFSCAPWEVVTFDPQEGFELVAWYDPDEVWFNFTFNNPAYPPEFLKLLWKKSKKEINEYADTIYSLLPVQNHWLIDCILTEREIQETADDEYDRRTTDMIAQFPDLKNPALTNSLLEPVMLNNEVDPDIQVALYRAKVTFDYNILSPCEEGWDSIL